MAHLEGPQGQAETAKRGQLGVFLIPAPRFCAIVRRPTGTPTLLNRPGRPQQVPGWSLNSPHELMRAPSSPQRGHKTASHIGIWAGPMLPWSAQARLTVTPGVPKFNNRARKAALARYIKKPKSGPAHGRPLWHCEHRGAVGTYAPVPQRSGPRPGPNFAVCELP